MVIESLEIPDVNGLNRFKSGFIVDNFADIELVMYYTQITMLSFIDMENREVR